MNINALKWAYLDQWPANGVYATVGKQNEHLIKSQLQKRHGPRKRDDCRY